MIKVLGNNIVNAFTGGNPVNAIYSYGQLVWERNTTKIIYTSKDGQVVNPYDSTVFGRANILSNTYSNGVGISNGWTASDTKTSQDGIRYKLNNLNFPQYSKFFHAAACHTIEFSGEIENFRKFYNIKPDGSGNNVAYIRIYNASLRDGGFSVKGNRILISSKI